MAGPDAIFRVDSFEGQQLPPKAQIKSIHVTRDQFAAETEQPGSTFVDVITQPGIGPIRGGANFSFRDGSMSAQEPVHADQGGRADRAATGSTSAARWSRRRAIFRCGERAEPVHHAEPERRAAERAAAIRRVEAATAVRERSNVNGLFDYALTRDQTLRFGYSQNNNSRGNQGIGAYDLPERAFTADQQPLHVPRARGRADWPAGLHQHAGDDDVDGLRVDSRPSRRRRSSCRMRSRAAARSRPAACTART